MTKDYKVIYRPIWTAGRYDETHVVAIYYNLLEGMSYFFEADSATVISKVLEIERNSYVEIESILNSIDIDQESLVDFLKELAQLNLISFDPITDERLALYRSTLAGVKKTHKYGDRPTKEKLPYAITSAEAAYAERVGGITSVMFEMTYNCSEKCIHCYNIGASRNDQEQSHRNLKDEMTLADYKEAIDKLYEKGLIKITLSGGDPFSKSCIWEVIEYAFIKGIAFDIFTNGQTIVNDTKRLASYFPRLVGISIYSGLPTVHDTITRVKGSFKRSLRVLEDLAEMAVPLNIKCCVMKPNYKSYRMVSHIADGLGAYAQFELNVTDSIEGDKCVSHYLRLSPHQYEKVLRDDNTPLYVGEEAPGYGGYEKDMTQSGCGAGSGSFCISPIGEVMPCCAFHMPVGNIKQQSLDTIMESPLLVEWQQLALKDYEECGQHDYCGFCNLCPGLAYSEHGDWRKASENCCYIAKLRHELASKMKNEGYDPIGGSTLDEVLQQEEDLSVKEIKRIMK